MSVCLCVNTNASAARRRWCDINKILPLAIFGFCCVQTLCEAVHWDCTLSVRVHAPTPVVSSRWHFMHANRKNAAARRYAVKYYEIIPALPRQVVVLFMNWWQIFRLAHEHEGVVESKIKTKLQRVPLRSLNFG